MRLISRIDADTGDTLVWCGDDFNPIATQTSLQQSGLTLLKVREDKWAVVGPIAMLDEENEDGRQEG
jgi:hypothetical protein